ncbi:MAG: PIN domain-containing protein [Thermoflexales bacterium]
MKAYVIDTHALYWYLAASPLLSARAKAAMDAAAAGKARLYVSAIVLAELFYLNAKHKGDLDVPGLVAELKSASQVSLVPLRAEDVAEFDLDADVPEMHDRIVTGLARRMKAGLITVARKIAECGNVEIVW